MKNALLLIFAAFACLTIGAQDRALPAAFRFPSRKQGAAGGKEFAFQVSELPAAQRDSVAYNELAQGNIPDFLRTPVCLTDSLPDAEGNLHSVTICLLPDFLAIGTDADFLRMPLLPLTAQKLADLYGATLPTRKLSDFIHRHSVLKLIPHPMTPDATMTTVPVFLRHDSIVEAARQTHRLPLSTLVAGHKKDIVITNRIATEPGRLFIYGWHYQDGTPIQPLSAAHGVGYVDYSHGVRLICNEVWVDGAPRSLKALLQDPALYTLFSDEIGPMAVTRF